MGNSPYKPRRLILRQVNQSLKGLLISEANVKMGARRRLKFEEIGQSINS